jgi:hypothetical protein
VNLFNNLKDYIKLSIVSLILSIFLLNSFTQFLSLDLSLKLTLIIIFLFNFFRLRNSFSFDNLYKFFILWFLMALLSRVIEYYLFLYIYSILSEKNFSLIITLGISSGLKFVYLNILKYFKI